jgi:thymidine phosphorylase
VLGRTAGHALEVREAIDWLTGKARDRRLDDVTLALGIEMLLLGRLARDRDGARRKLIAARDSGAAAERFQRMAAALGGPVDLLERPEKHLRRAAVERPVETDRRGFIARLDVRAVGLAILSLGGGRRRVEDRIDDSVGVAAMQGIGDEVGPGRPLAIVHARDSAGAEQAAAEIRAAVEIAGAPVTAGPLIRDRIAGA